VKRIPFDAPEHLTTIVLVSSPLLTSAYSILSSDLSFLQFLRQQLVFNELFLSCFGCTKPQSTIPSRGEGRQIGKYWLLILVTFHLFFLITFLAVKAMEVRTEAPQSISVTGWFGSGLFKMDVRIREDGSLEAKLLSPSTTLSSLDNYVSKVISVCHSIPLTMYNIFAKLTQLQHQQK
jgi:hypothetical protein